MATEVELFKQYRHDELWQICCGFIDLSLDEFMAIQQRLLSEQLGFLKQCELGRYLINGANISNLEDFRTLIPLTTYDDYAPYLLNKKEVGEYKNRLVQNILFVIVFIIIVLINLKKFI